jgi:hypothetical protein
MNVETSELLCAAAGWCGGGTAVVTMELGQPKRQVSRMTITWPRPGVNIPKDRELAKRPFRAGQWSRIGAANLCNLRVAVQNGRFGQPTVVLGCPLILAPAWDS